MARFFRHIRQHLFRDGRFSRYLLYAVGEIVLVVIGILIALQINGCEQQRAQNREERRLLTNLQTDLRNDLAELTIIIQSSLDRQANMDTLLTILARPDDYTKEHFLRLVLPLFYESNFEVNSGTFDESLAAGTIKFIQDDSLRQQIFEYYRDAKLSYADQNALKLMYELILPQFAQTIAPSREFIDEFAKKPSLLPGLDLAAIARNEDFYSMLILKFGTEADQVLHWRRYKEAAEELVSNVEGQVGAK